MQLCSSKVVWNEHDFFCTGIFMREREAGQIEAGRQVELKHDLPAAN